MITLGRSFAIIKWSPNDPDQHKIAANVIHTVDKDLPKNFFNDGKCDDLGRLWAGWYDINNIII